MNKIKDPARRLYIMYTLYNIKRQFRGRKVLGSLENIASNTYAHHRHRKLLRAHTLHRVRIIYYIRKRAVAEIYEIYTISHTRS